MDSMIVIWFIIGQGLYLPRLIHALTNIALNKPAFQSSGYKPEVYAGRAVNGDLSDACCGANCIATYADYAPYWGVDLQGTYKVSSLHVVPRSTFGCTGTCAQRAGMFDIRVGFSKESFSSNDQCTYFNDVVDPGVPRDIACDVPTCGRYVTLHRTGGPYNEPLNLCEVMVYADASPVRHKSLRANIKEVNKYLASHAVLSEPVKSTTDCLRLCLDYQESCRSVNVYVTGDVTMCDVNNKAADSGLYPLTDDVTSTYYGLGYSRCG